MYRFACAVLLGAIVWFAGPVGAQLPMSPVIRTDQAGKEHPAAKTPAAAPAAAETSRAMSDGEAAVVATAPIPPPPSGAAPAKPAAEPAKPGVEAAAALPPPAANAEAVEPRAKRHATHRRRVPSRYRTAYQAAGAWPGAWGASGSWHYGPNPYSPNGGD